MPDAQVKKSQVAGIYRKIAPSCRARDRCLGLAVIEDGEDVLGEFRRILRPGGRLAMVNMTIVERRAGISTIVCVAHARRGD